ncbi:Crp/Fnr family transcriptional regulator [Cupriavidus basilensis]
MSKPFTTEDRLAALKSSAWFAGLTAGLQGWIAEHSRVRALAAGEPPVPPRRCAGRPLLPVVDGAVRMTRTSEQGKEALLAFAEAPQWFGEISLFDGLPRTHDAWVQSDAMLLHTPQSDHASLSCAKPIALESVRAPAHAKAAADAKRHRSVGIAAGAGRGWPQRFLAIAGGYGERHGRSKRVIHVQQGGTRADALRLPADGEPDPQGSRTARRVAPHARRDRDPGYRAVAGVCECGLMSRA